MFQQKTSWILCTYFWTSTFPSFQDLRIEVTSVTKISCLCVLRSARMTERSNHMIGIHGEHLPSVYFQPQGTPETVRRWSKIQKTETKQLKSSRLRFLIGCLHQLARCRSLRWKFGIFYGGIRFNLAVFFRHAETTKTGARFQRFWAPASRHRGSLVTGSDHLILPLCTKQCSEFECSKIMTNHILCLKHAAVTLYRFFCHP